jgi:hypothetical protein
MPLRGRQTALQGEQNFDGCPLGRALAPEAEERAGRWDAAMERHTARWSVG